MTTATVGVALTPRETVASSVRALCAFWGVEAAELAESVGIRQSTLYTRWKAERPYSLEELARVAAFYGLPVQDLLDGLPHGMGYRPELPHLDSNQKPAGYVRRWLSLVVDDDVAA